MKTERKILLAELIKKHKELGVSEQLDFEKFYLYSLIVHSTAIEGSTVTEVEAQLLFDEGITSNKRSMVEQLMNLDLKEAYEFGREWIASHSDISVEWLCRLSGMVMRRTGSEYKAMGGDFSSAKGELRKLNVTAGVGGRSYMSYLKVPQKLSAFCDELNRKRRAVDPDDICSVYEMSFWAHYELVTIHPWADGNGRMSRLLMNLLQMEFGVLPSKVLVNEKSDYIQSLIDSRDNDDVEIFIDKMAGLHISHLESDITKYLEDLDAEIVDKSHLERIIVDKLGEISDKSFKRGFINNLITVALYVKAHPHCSASEISSHVVKSASMVRNYIHTLIEMGLVRADGANKNRTYQFV